MSGRRSEFGKRMEVKWGMCWVGVSGNKGGRRGREGCRKSFE